MLLALTINGIIYSHIKIGAYNGDEFIEWIEGLLEVMTLILHQTVYSLSITVVFIMLKVLRSYVSSSKFYFFICHQI